MKKQHKIGNRPVLWVHTYPSSLKVGGVWMYNQYEFLKEDVDLYYLNNLRNPFYFILHMFRLISLSKQYHIAHAQYGSAAGFLTSLMSCTKILSLKGSDWYIAPNPSRFQKCRIFLGNLMTRFSLKRFKHIIVMSEEMKRQVLAKYPKATVEVIVDPIDLDKFKPIPQENENAVKKVLFAAVNLTNPIKRFSLAQKSFELLQKKMPNTELITMSNVSHDEVCQFMNKVDVLLLTSTHEGWPNVVKEILACNKPFVSTNVSDLELIANKTKSCYVCEDTPLALSKALFKSLNAEKENLRWLVEDFNMEETIKKYKNIYKSYLPPTF